MTRRTVVIGIGNGFRRDDGVGPAVAALLAGRLPGVEVAESDGEPTGLMELWTGARFAVVVDAIRLGRAVPGRVHRVEAPDLASGWPPPAAHTHAVQLGDVVELARALDRLPDRLLVYAVEVADTGYGLDMSPPVAAAAARIADEITQLLAEDGGED